MDGDSEQTTPRRRRRHAALDVRLPFFRPLWRRIATVAVIAGWTAMELWGGNPYWAVLAGGIGIYTIYEFFIVFDPRDYEAGEKEKGS
ncbi:hypothetical protein ACRDNQ_11350 [Palleronia sp. KMU-117]|uniref:hypothetical protein n=1 Tax=Palleronia sp. KMU-117 TaxID=3434108 RepID=UPI003D733E54